MYIYIYIYIYIYNNQLSVLDTCGQIHNLLDTMQNDSLAILAAGCQSLQHAAYAAHARVSESISACSPEREHETTSLVWLVCLCTLRCVVSVLS